MTGDPPYNIPNYSRMSDEELNELLRLAMTQGTMFAQNNKDNPEGMQAQIGMDMYPKQQLARTRAQQLAQEAARRGISAKGYPLSTAYGTGHVQKEFFGPYVYSGAEQGVVNRNPVPASVNPVMYPNLNMGTPNAGPTLMTQAMGGPAYGTPGHLREQHQARMFYGDKAGRHVNMNEYNTGSARPSGFEPSMRQRLAEYANSLVGKLR